MIPEEEEIEIVNVTEGQQSWLSLLGLSKKQNAATYGELTIEGTHTLIQELSFNQEDIFWDLGCGTGKVI